MIGRRQRTALLAALVTWCTATGLAAQANIEEQAHRQLESGMEFYRAGRFAEALKDFQTVAEGYPTSTVADDAMLAIANYQLDIQRDPVSARTTADSLIKKYATSDSAPMGYVVMGRATLMIDQTPAGLDSALASFDRVPRLFPWSDAVAPALYYGADVERRAGKADAALDRLRDVALQYPRAIWAARAALLEARLLVAASQPLEAMRSLQRVIRGFAKSPEAGTAEEWNTVLYRLYVRPPAESSYVSSGRSLSAQTGDRFKDVESIAIGPDGKLGLATRGGILMLDDRGAVTRTAPATEPKEFGFDERGRVIIFQRSVILHETDRGMQRFALTAATSGGPKLLQDISAGGTLSNGEFIVADRDLRAAYRFSASGQFLKAFSSGRISRIFVSLADDVAVLDSDQKEVEVTDRLGNVRTRIPRSGTGYQFEAPSDVAFDMFENVYVLDRTQVFVFAPGGRLLVTFTPDPSSAFKKGQALALDSAARLYVYDDSLGRVLIYQ
jgi:TolA-binding protein